MLSGRFWTGRADGASRPNGAAASECASWHEGLKFPENENNFLSFFQRYMAPEVLNRSLNAANFEEFKWADIYSFALLLWEILNRIEPLPVEDEAGKEAPVGRRQQQRLISAFWEFLKNF